MIAVLLSGGLDSAVLVADEATRDAVQPVYINAGLVWESPERAAAINFLTHAPFRHPVQPMAALSVDMTDIYPPTHWARSGVPPGYDSPDEEVYLTGRNIILLGKAAVLCAVRGIDRLAIGTLAGNPFPDATPAFRASLADALSLGLGRRLEIVAPYADTRKAEVIRRGAQLGIPLALTLSCMRPQGVDSEGAPLHCGACNKCRERREAFVAAGVSDPTRYQMVAQTGE